MSRWQPAMVVRHYDRRPPVGGLIAYQRKAWRVLAVEDYPREEWTAEQEEAWAGRAIRGHEPMRVEVSSPDGSEVGRMTVGPRYVSWDVLPEHYAVCVSCGELAPCVEHTSMVAAQAAMAQAERDMATLPGCCAACQEPVTHRQEAVRFPGENLLVPLGSPGVIFHLRRSCRGSAARYEEMWVAADPTRPRSLLTLSCEGSLIVHGDGSAECHSADPCPSIYADHRVIAACYTQSHGCGRGCSVTGHPGARAPRAQGIRP